MPNLMKTRPEGAELIHADGQIKGKKLSVVFRNFAQGPKT